MSDNINFDKWWEMYKEKNKYKYFNEEKELGNKGDKSNKKNKVITLTFGDMAENHKGMQQIGEMVKEGEGFSLADFKNIIEEYKDYKCELVNLSLDTYPESYVLVIRDGVNKLLEKDGFCEHDLFNEQANLNYDKKAFMYGRVVNKNARWNLCFDYESQEPDYENGKGRIVKFSDMPITSVLYSKFSIFGKKAENL